MFKVGEVGKEKDDWVDVDDELDLEVVNPLRDMKMALEMHGSAEQIKLKYGKDLKRLNIHPDIFAELPQSEQALVLSDIKSIKKEARRRTSEQLYRKRSMVEINMSLRFRIYLTSQALSLEV